MTKDILLGPDGLPVEFYTPEVEGPRKAKSVEVMSTGFKSVAHMLATPGFTMAHRGSGNGGRWPEMTLLGYTQAVRLGYGVLEVSCNRTSDGVWFGMHDQYLDRIALGTNGTTLNPINMTWAQVNQYVVNQAGRVKSPQPIMRLDELIEAYGDTHILLMDPKYRRNDRLPEFFDIMQSIGPDRAIIKADLDFPWAITELKKRDPRFKGWGYFWATGSPALNNDPQFDSWVAAWDFIGPEWSDPQAVYDRITALGKPIIAHIAESQAQYDTAISKGAIGVQCGAIQLITAVGA